MDEDDRDLVNRLFVTATAMLEDLTATAVAGQSASASSEELSGVGEALMAEVRRIGIIAEAGWIIASRNDQKESAQKDPR